MLTEVSVVLRYRFGSISIDLSKHSGYFREALNISGSVMFMHMNGPRLQQFLRTHYKENAEFAAQINDIQEKFSVIKPDFLLIECISQFDEGEFIYSTNERPARNFVSEVSP